jgi:excisionase family DNA binding protein
MTNDASKPLTTGDIARYCHVTPVTIFNWIKAGRLKSFTTAGGHNRILPEDFRAFLAANLMPIPPDFRERQAPAPRRRRRPESSVVRGGRGLDSVEWDHGERR